MCDASSRKEAFEEKASDQNKEREAEGRSGQEERREERVWARKTGFDLSAQAFAS